MTGILLVALLIGYLPTIFAAVQQREQGIAALAAHVGLPLSGEAILIRYAGSPGLAHLDELWTDWRRWFAALGESQTVCRHHLRARPGARAVIGDRSRRGA